MSSDQWLALAALIGILLLGFSLIPFNAWLDRRAARREARRRNQAHPWD